MSSVFQWGGELLVLRGGTCAPELQFGKTGKQTVAHKEALLTSTLDGQAWRVTVTGVGLE